MSEPGGFSICDRKSSGLFCYSPWEALIKARPASHVESSPYFIEDIAVCKDKNADE